MSRGCRVVVLALLIATAGASDANAVGYTSIGNVGNNVTIMNSQDGYSTSLDIKIEPGGAGAADDVMVVTTDISSASGCTMQSATVARCPLTATRRNVNATFTGGFTDYSATIDLDRPDAPMTATVTMPLGEITQQSVVDGSATTRGRLTLTGRKLTGGGDDDALTGGALADQLDGGPGDDTLNGAANNDSLIGGPGDDAFIPGTGASVTVAGGEGTQDSISYAGENSPVNLTLNDVADGDGVPAEGRVVHMTGIENASGGDNADHIVGNAGFNHLYGLAGNDQIDGGGGAHDVLRGGADDDAITARDAPALFGDIACGNGTDSAVVDALDVVASDCESVARSAPDPVPAGGGSGGGGSGGGGSGGAGGGNGSADDRTSPELTLIKPPSKIKRATLLKGVTLTLSTDEPAKVVAGLVGKAKKVTLARVGEITIAESSLRLGSGQRKLTLKPSKKLLGRAKKLTLLITATDAAGNQRTLRRTIKIS